jgi:hypothetical protein
MSCLSLAGYARTGVFGLYPGEDGMMVLPCADSGSPGGIVNEAAGAGVPVPARERRGHRVRSCVVYSTRKRAGVPGVVANVCGMPQLMCTRPPSRIVATWPSACTSSSPDKMKKISSQAAWTCGGGPEVAAGIAQATMTAAGLGRWPG